MTPSDEEFPMHFLSLIFLSALVPFTSARAAGAEDDGAYLDPPYRHAERTHVLASGPRDLQPSRNDVTAVIQAQTPVKSQASRGTCSIFASTALLESMMVLRGDFKASELDLSEEWLEYALMQNQNTEGSGSTANARALLRFGSTLESLMPYIGETWEEGHLEWNELARSRCGAVPKDRMDACLLGHRDPRLMTTTNEELTNGNGDRDDAEFREARSFAHRFSRDHLSRLDADRSWIPSDEGAKALLRAGVPLTLDLDFFYGAWNHRVADKLGIGRDLDAWSQGLVGYPEPGSMDLAHSSEDPAGHVVVVVGYDDERELVTHVKMTDGSTRTFTYRGVYYFKNSWGTSSFGAQTEIDGHIQPGYGVITQKYAHEHGTFYRLKFTDQTL
jgi:hypothetical protein